jgi:hypothetical protein
MVVRRDLLHEPALDAQNPALLIDVQSRSYNPVTRLKRHRLAIIFRLQTDDTPSRVGRELINPVSSQRLLPAITFGPPQLQACVAWSP